MNEDQKSDIDNVTKPTRRKRKEVTTYTSLRKLATDKGVSVELLKSARDIGCPGFEANGRAHWDAIKPWLETNASQLKTGNTNDNISDWKKRLVAAQAQRAELELARSRDNYMSREKVIEIITSIATAQRNILKTKLADELPPKLYGLGVAEITKVMMQTINDTCKLMQQIKL